MVLILARTLNLEVEEMYVKITFLYGNSREEIYIEQLEVFINKGKEDLACRWQKKPL
jgi:hypothetical protein